MLLAYCFLLSPFPFEVACVQVRDCALHDTIGLNGDIACLLPAAFSFALCGSFSCVLCASALFWVRNGMATA
jgi:hypothetical protein